MGRPSNIASTVGFTEPDDGTPPQPILLWQRIVEAVRVGSYLEPAVKRAGIHHDTAYGWLEIAGRIRLRSRGQAIDESTLTDHELHCLQFSEALDEAEGMWEVGALTLLERLARGGLEIRKTTTKRDATGAVVEVSETVETLAPNAQVIEWRLTRRHQERWSQRLTLAGEVEVSISDEERAELLVQTLDVFLAGQPKKKRALRKKPAVG
jgi:hypothetical protein